MSARGQKEKQELELYFNHLNLSPVREFKFHPTRRWRFDYAFPELKIAIEYEGIVSAKSRHTTMKGYTGDCEKYNEAAILGWKVIRITALMFKNLKALDFIERIIKNDQDEKGDLL